MPFKIGDHTPLPFDSPLPYPQSKEFYDLTEGLDNLSLEQNRYFGLGKSMCEMAILLTDPVIREETISSAAANVKEIFSNFGDFPGLRIKDIGALTPLAFSAVTLEATRRLPIAERLLTVALGQRASDRRQNIAIFPAAYRIAGIQQPDRLATTLRFNAQAGAGSILRRALLAYSQGKASEESLLTDVIGKNTLIGLRLERVAQALASLRIDEFRDWEKGKEPVRDIVKPGLKGELVVNKTYLKKNQPGAVEVNPKNGSVPVLREDRLTCPALQTGLIPIIMKMLPEIAIEADALIRNHYRRSDI